MEREVVLDRGGRLNRLYLKGCTDIGQRAGAERKRFGMVLLPALVLCTQIERARVLEVRWENYGFVTSLTRKLNTEIPRVKRHEGEFQVIRQQVLLSKGIEAVDSIAECAGVADMLPCQGGQTRYNTRQS